MDSLTHIFAGALTGELLAGNKIGKKAMFYGAAFNTLPDLDVFSEWFTSEPHSMLIHRGITHSFLFSILFPLLCALLMQRKQTTVGFKGWYVFVFIQLFFHNIIDSLTAYGTGWWEPFSDKRVSFHLLFVADPLFSIAPLLCFLVLLFTGKKFKYKKGTALIGLLIPLVYLVAVCAVKNSILNKINRQEHQASTNEIITPTPFNSLLWMHVINYDTTFKIGYHSFFDKNCSYKYYTLYKNNEALYPFMNNSDVLRLQQFSEGYYSISIYEGAVYFNDLRFGQMGGWADSTAPFAFSYRVNGNEKRERAFNRNRMNGGILANLTGLWERINCCRSF